MNTENTPSTPNTNNTNLKKIALGLTLLAAGVVAGWVASQWQAGRTGLASTAAAAAVNPTGAAPRKPLYWYDPMVPTQRFDQPGKSPFMDMQLVPKYGGEADDANQEAAQALSVSAQAQQLLGVRVATVERANSRVNIDAVGTVQLNERDVSIVQARAAGFVERVYARAPGDVLAAGAPLADLLLPDWVAAQREFLAVQALNEAALTQAARQRLLLLGLPDTLIAELERSRQTQASYTLRAPSPGLLVELNLRQGMTVTPGMSLARINGLAQVWLEAAVPEAQAAALRAGQTAEARLSAFPGEVFRGKVAAVLAESNRDTRTLRVRIELPNPQQRLTAGMFAQVSLQGPPLSAVLVPAEAIIRTGKRALAYVVDAPGRFRPVEVEIGAELGDQLVVLRGLEPGQQVVASAQFLIDSEASLQGLLPTPLAAVAATATDTTTATAPKTPAATKATPAPPQAQAQSHSTTGTITAISGDELTLQHAPVASLQWPAMTMGFKLSNARLKTGLQPQQRVQFSFIQQGDDYVITAITAIAAAEPKGKR